MSPRAEKKLSLRKAKEAKVAINRVKEGQGERDNNILSNNMRVSDIFFLRLTVMQYLYRSV